MESIIEMNQVLASIFQAPEETDERNMTLQELTSQKWREVTRVLERAVLQYERLVRHAASNISTFNITLLVAKVIITPNTVNLKISWRTSIPQKSVTLLTVVLIFLAYLVLGLWAARKDRVTKVKISVLPDQEPFGNVCFALTLYRGSHLGAGTMADVFLQLVGQDGTSDVFCLQHPHFQSFCQGSTDTFLLSAKKDLGDICALRIWHNNKGSSPDWFLSRAKVENVQNKKTWFFICRKWLALHKDDRSLERTVFTMNPKPRVSRADPFSINLEAKLRDGHLWLSIFAHPGTGTFSRFQRLSCCFAILLLNLLVNFMFFRADKREECPPPMRFWRPIALGVEKALIMIPVEMLTIASFRYSQEKPFSTLEGDNFQRQNKQLSTVSCLFCKGAHLVFCWGCAFFSWALVISVMGLSSFFIIFYGLTYGHDTSLQWLLASAYSFVKNVFFFQPLKILLFSALSTLLPKYCQNIPRSTQENYSEFNMDKATETEGEMSL